ncbi:Alpha/Beta hydrolase protein [Aspergillus insuetus]
MPSSESQAFLRFFGPLIHKSTSQPEVWARPEVGSYLYESVHLLATEPEDVCYKTVNCPGTQQPAIWVTPINADKAAMILYFHGGSFTAGSPSSHRKMVAHIAKAAGVQAVLIDYRKLPHHLYPAAHEDSVSAYRWLIESEGFLPSKIASMGDLAGVHLAMTLPHNAREAGLAPPGAVVAISPWLDLETRNQGLDTFAHFDPTVNQGHLEKFCADYYVKNGGIRLTDPKINVLYSDLSIYPPTYLCWGTNEALQDNGPEFTELATAAGADVETEIVDGMYHCYTFMAGNAPEADTSIANIGDFLRRKLLKV